MKISRNPSDYSFDPGGHFQQQKRKRNIPGEAIRACIEQGEVSEQENGNIRFEAKYNGIRYWMIVNPENNQAITIYPKGMDDRDMSEKFGVASQTAKT